MCVVEAYRLAGSVKLIFDVKVIHIIQTISNKFK